MSLFDEANRLVRCVWTDPNLLAQELFAIFRTDQSVDAGPITASNGNDTSSPITINQNANSPWPAITVTRGNQTYNWDPTNSGGGIDLGNIPIDNKNDDGTATTNPLSLWGIVQAKVADNQYTVKVYTKDPTTSPAWGTLTVTQAQIDPDEVIPQGTEVIVIAFVGKKPGETIQRILASRMQVPIFLPRA